MTKQIPCEEPKEFVAGDTVQWTKSLAEFTPGDGYTLKYRLVGGSAFSQEITADIATYPGSYLLTFTAAHTAAIKAQTVMRLIGWVENADATEKYTTYDQVVTLLPNARTATAAELLTHEEKVLAAIEAVLEKRATSDQAEYTIKNVSVTKMTVEELLRWRGIYRGIVWRQRNQNQSFPSHAVRMRAPR